MESDKEYLTVKDLCEIYGVSKTTVMNWRKAGIPFVRLGTRMIRFKKEEVEQWLTTRE